MKNTNLRLLSIVFAIVFMTPLLTVDACAQDVQSGVRANQDFAAMYPIGKGTREDPYRISGANQLAYLGVLGKELSNLYFQLTNDIDLQGIAWTPIPEFYGTLDADLHTIYNLYLAPSIANNGLINALYGTVQNLGIASGRVDCSPGYVQDECKLPEPATGAIAGICYGTIQNCYSNADFVGSGLLSQSIGGLVGKLSGGTVLNCYTIGTFFITSITPTYRPKLGAVVGSVVKSDNVSQINNCCFQGNFTVEKGSTYSGGIVGYLDTDFVEIDNCYFQTNADVGVGFSAMAYRNLPNVRYIYSPTKKMVATNVPNIDAIVDVSCKTRYVPTANELNLRAAQIENAAEWSDTQGQPPSLILQPPKKPFAVHATTSPGGQIIPSGVLTAQENDSIHFTLSPEVGYVLEHLLVNTVQVFPNNNEYILQNIFQDVSIEASFVKIPYKIQFYGEGGMFICVQTAAYGTVILPPQPPMIEGSAFVGWYDNPQLSGDPITDFTVLENRSFYAKYQVLPPTLATLSGKVYLDAQPIRHNAQIALFRESDNALLSVEWTKGGTFALPDVLGQAGAHRLVLLKVTDAADEEVQLAEPAQTIFDVPKVEDMCVNIEARTAPQATPSPTVPPAPQPTPAPVPLPSVPHGTPMPIEFLPNPVKPTEEGVLVGKTVRKQTPSGEVAILEDAEVDRLQSTALKLEKEGKRVRILIPLNRYAPTLCLELSANAQSKLIAQTNATIHVLTPSITLEISHALLLEMMHPTQNSRIEIVRTQSSDRTLRHQIALTSGETPRPVIQNPLRILFTRPPQATRAPYAVTPETLRAIPYETLPNNRVAITQTNLAYPFTLIPPPLAD